MTFPATFSVRDVNPRDHPAVVAFAPWFDFLYILDDKITMQYARGDHFPDGVSPFALDYDDLRLHMWASDTESETSKFVLW